MSNTRFMERLFSATENGEAELTDQVAADIESAQKNGSVDTDEVIYEKDGDGRVSITDKETGEVTIAEKASDEDGTYDLYNPEDAVEEPLEGYLHPEGDGVTPGEQEGTEMEDVEEDHLGGMEISELDPSCEEDCEETREFSMTTNNVAILRYLSDRAFCEKCFSEVIESEQTSIVGDLKIEKDSEDEDTVIITSESTGDQAKVAFDGETVEVTELESKNFSEFSEADYAPLYVVGVDTDNHVLVDAPVYDEEAANDLVNKLSEQGVEAVQVFETSEEARDYAFKLFDSFDAIPEEGDVEEPVQAEFSDHDVFLTKFYSSNTVYMDRLFSEAVNDVETSQDAIEDAIESGDEIETDTEIVTPIDASTAVIEDKETGEFTKVSLEGDVMDLDPISEKEAEDLTDHLVTNGEEVDEDEEEEKDFSDIYCNEEETRFFSESEEMTEYMVRLYSEEADQDEIEDAIESGEQIENDTEIITPVDASTAVIEDKETGEFTKAEVDGETIDVNPISEEEADKLTEDLAVEDKDFSEEDIDSVEEEEKEFSTLDKFFAEAVMPQPVAVAQPAVAPVPAPVAAVPVEGQATQIEAAVEEVPTVEVIEDKALAAIQSIQEATMEATQAITAAKEAPVQQVEGDIKEAQFSTPTEEVDNVMISWLKSENLRK